VPFYDRWGTIPNEKGRVLTEHESGIPVTGNYVVGWIKRGPSGVIGTNKPDSVETAMMLLEDAQAGKLFNPADPNRRAVEQLLHDRGVYYVTYEDWLILDKLEQERGAAVKRPRVKFSSVPEMLDALTAARKTPDPAGD
jgi:ferredoxin--NADP+ reductase